MGCGGNAELPALSYTSPRRSQIAQSIRFRIQNKAETTCFKQKSRPWGELRDFLDQLKKETYICPAGSILGPPHRRPPRL